jgi:hypothetical protein
MATGWLRDCHTNEQPQTLACFFSHGFVSAFYDVTDNVFFFLSRYPMNGTRHWQIGGRFTSIPAAYADDLSHNGPLLFLLEGGCVGAALILLILVSSKSDR